MGLEDEGFAAMKGRKMEFVKKENNTYSPELSTSNTRHWSVIVNGHSLGTA